MTKFRSLPSQAILLASATLGLIVAPATWLICQLDIPQMFIGRIRSPEPYVGVKVLLVLVFSAIIVDIVVSLLRAGFYIRGAGFSYRSCLRSVYLFASTIVGTSACFVVAFILEMILGKALFNR